MTYFRAASLAPLTILVALLCASLPVGCDITDDDDARASTPTPTSEQSPTPTFAPESTPTAVPSCESSWTGVVQLNDWRGIVIDGWVEIVVRPEGTAHIRGGAPILENHFNGLEWHEMDFWANCMDGSIWYQYSQSGISESFEGTLFPDGHAVGSWHYSYTTGGLPPEHGSGSGPWYANKLTH